MTRVRTQYAPKHARTIHDRPSNTHHAHRGRPYMTGRPTHTTRTHTHHTQTHNFMEDDTQQHKQARTQLNRESRMADKTTGVIQISTREVRARDDETPKTTSQYQPNKIKTVSEAAWMSMKSCAIESAPFTKHVNFPSVITNGAA